MRRSRTNIFLLGLVALTTAGLAACKSDGRTLRPADPSQNQSVYTASTTTTALANAFDTVGVAPVTAAPLTFALTLPWVDGGEIDPRYTCNGDGVQPQVGWLGAPEDAVEMALVVNDIDANNFVHWIIAGLDPLDPLIPENTVPPGAIEGLNGFSNPAAPLSGWRGPCPPAGGVAHHYRFTLYALDQQVELPPGSTAADLQAVIDATAIAAAQATGVYATP